MCHWQLRYILRLKPSSAPCPLPIYASSCLCLSKVPSQKTWNYPRLSPPHTIHHQATWVSLSNLLSNPCCLPQNWFIASSPLAHTAAVLPTLSPQYISNQLSSPHVQSHQLVPVRDNRTSCQQVSLSPVLLNRGARMNPTHPFGHRINVTPLRETSLAHPLKWSPHPSIYACNILEFHWSHLLPFINIYLIWFLFL